MTYKQSRRIFLQKTALLTGGLFLGSHFPDIRTLANDQENMANTVRLGIIGSGSRGQYLMTHINLIPGIEIVAVCDNYQPNLDKGVEMTGGKAEAFNDYRKLLEKKNIDGVIIATPLHLHAVISIDSLKAGFHVFCEKAMAKTPAECLAMYNAQLETGKILLIGHQRMFNPRYLKAFEMINRGQLGDITQIRAYWHRNNDWRREVPETGLEREINWRLYWDYSEGLMTELGSHQIQVANFIKKDFPRRVTGTGSINYWHDGREVFDNVNMVYEYSDGSSLIYDSMISNAHYGYEEQIMGPKGTMELEAGKMYSENPPPAPGILQLLNNIEHEIFDPLPLGGKSWIPETAVKEKGEYIYEVDLEDDGTALEMEGFAQMIRENRHSDVLLREAYYAAIAALLGNMAIKKGEVVTFPEEYIL
ncbi:MAG: Gfo/Idh/MocA family oxidoreductase [Bacteroidales bacterium]|nr:Gfo/Idh/MocA family oxidoreductase [Bacteroidales bacterium]